MSTLTAFEKRVLDAFLAGDDQRLSLLRLQAEAAVVASREHTGVGAYINFSVPDSSSLLEPGTFIIGDLNLEIAGLPDGVTTLLYGYGGRIQFLEFATHADEWPEEPEIIGVGYLQEVQVGPETFSLVPSNERHLETLNRAIEAQPPQGPV
ncbi:hypothetical protein FHY17_001613 [Xanthomonas arboricola]|uniref:hypothetical protein n=1 Tax=Xanthomonas arboricola TaxID=56448 RepID=UPI001607CD37|nr:hypothetical protein [Xanthomonas arboricola]MBB3797385.1 hypothetical protein [Xanthomonas arboricola]